MQTYPFTTFLQSIFKSERFTELCFKQFQPGTASPSFESRFLAAASFGCCCVFFFNRYLVSILLCAIQSCHSYLSLKFERLGTPKPLPLCLHPSFIENDDGLCRTSLNRGLPPWWGRLQPAGTTSQRQIHGLNGSLSSGFVPLLLLASVFPHGLLFYLGAHDCIWQGLLIVSTDFTGDWF